MIQEVFNLGILDQDVRLVVHEGKSDIWIAGFVQNISSQKRIMQEGINITNLKEGRRFFETGLRIVNQLIEEQQKNEG